ncbi:MAG: leucine-rich repeat domain-containing protein [Holosporales bacterium]
MKGRIKRVKALSHALVLGASSLFSTGAVAKISPLAFKTRTTNVFKKDMDYYDPVLGEAALESGLISNLRFMGNYTEAMGQDGEPDYVNDSSDDPTWTLVHALFPSVAGFLATDTRGDQNFGHYVEDPQVVGVLLNYAHALRKQKHLEEEAEKKKLEAQEKEIDPSRSTSPRTKKTKVAQNPYADLNHVQELVFAGLRTAEERELIEGVKQALKTLRDDESLEASWQALAGGKVKKGQTKEEREIEQNKNAELRAQLVTKLGEKLKQTHSSFSDLSDKVLNNLVMELAKVKKAEQRIIDLEKQGKPTKTEKFLAGKAEDSALVLLDDVIYKKTKSARRESIRHVLNSIKASIEQEPNSIYPAFTTEQILNAFFCEKADSVTDIYQLLDTLDEDIVDQKALLETKDQYTADNLLNADDIRSIVQKNHLEIEDLHDLAYARIAMNAANIPFTTTELVSNGTTKMYNRAKNAMTDFTFQDCVEVSFRHQLFMHLYDPSQNINDLSFLKEHQKVVGSENPYLNNLIDFFEKFGPQKASNGDIYIRSEWNRVVGDLNAFEQQNQDPNQGIRYVQNGNELEPGYVNFVKIFEKILGLTPVPLPVVPVVADEDDTILGSWLQERLQSIFTVMNPQLDLEIDADDLVLQENELYGQVRVRAKDKKTGEKRFSYVMDHNKQHTELEKVKDFGHEKLPAEAQALLEEANSKFESYFASSNDLSAKEVLTLLSANKVTPKNVLYWIFSQNLDDNESLLDFMDNLAQQYDALAETHPQILPILHKVLGHTLDNIGWDDGWVLTNMIGTLEKMKKINHLVPVLQEHARFLVVDKDDDYKAYKRLKHLQIKNVPKGVFEITENMKGLKTLVADDNIYNLRQISGLGNAKKLELIQVAGARRLSGALHLDQKLERLEIINVSNTGLSSIEGIENAPNLTRLILRNLANFNSVIDLKQSLPKLKYIDATESTLRGLRGLGFADDLESIDLFNTKAFAEELVFEGSLNRLEILNASLSGVRGIRGLECAPNLKSLILDQASNLEGTIDLGELKENLQEIKLAKTSISRLENLHYAPNLNSLDLSQTHNFASDLIFEGPMARLHDLKLENSGLTGIQGLHHLQKLSELTLDSNFGWMKPLKIEGEMPNLTKISISQTLVSGLEGLEQNAKNLSQLHLEDVAMMTGALRFSTPMEHLETIILSGEGFETIADVHNLPNLKRLSLYKNQNIEGAYQVPEGLANLTILNLAETKVSSIDGLENAPALKWLLVAETNNLTQLNFNKENDALERINAVGSALHRIEGLHRLKNLSSLELPGDQEVVARVPVGFKPNFKVRSGNLRLEEDERLN